MKRTFQVLIIFVVLIGSFFLNVGAYNEEENLSQNVKQSLEETGLISDVEIIQAKSKDNGYTMRFYSIEDGGYYEIYQIDNMTYVKNLDTDEVVLRITTTTIEERSAVEVAREYIQKVASSSYETWGGYVFLGTYRFKMDDYQMASITLLTSAVTFLLGTLGFVINSGLTIATAIYNSNQPDWYVNKYIATNAHCPILVKTRAYTYTGSGRHLDTSYSHEWYGYPWDYSQPAACRTLVNTYGY